MSGFMFTKFYDCSCEFTPDLCLVGYSKGPSIEVWPLCTTSTRAIVDFMSRT